ncbi:hypothetical protein D915_001515 [Fasciola hepatica]|uniref:Uncharacterized protein n=1 Tax=Fasciola hepatica TaxID=6192 RepID=A0A4E0RFR9_FASHE|nr:hypothetical protein D915_001515 [Fasciola hepatica]
MESNTRTDCSLRFPMSIRLKVVPFTSPIATQLQLEKLHELDRTTKPTATIPGTLIIDLPLAEPIQLAISLTYQDVKRCLVGLQAKTGGQSNGSDGSPETFGQKIDNSLEL